MKKSNFPNVEQGLISCLFDLCSVEVFGVYKKGRLIAAFLFGDDGCKGAFLDLVCLPKHQSTWLQKGVVSKLIEEAAKYKVIWVEPKQDYALKICLKAGFQPVKNKFTTPLLVSTSQQLQQRFFKNKG